MEFDESQAIGFIRERLGEEISNLYDDDELLNVIDIIWDFYEENGLLDIDMDDEIEEESLFDDLKLYAARMLKKDKGSKIRPEHIAPIIEAEIEYENSLGSEF